MKVFLCTKTSLPNGMAATSRVKNYLRTLHLSGIECEAVVYYRSEVYGNTPKNTEAKGCFEGIPYRYISDTVFRSSNLIIRHIDDLFDRMKLLYFIRHHVNKGDIVFYYNAGQAVFARLIAHTVHRLSAGFVSELCEFPYVFGSQTWYKKCMLKYTLNILFRHCDGIIAISDTLKSLALRYASAKCQVIKIPILVDLRQYVVKEESFISNTPFVFHSGTLSDQKDGITGMLTAFGMFREKTGMPMKMVLTGSLDRSPDKEDIRRIISKYDLSNDIIFTGYIEDSQVYEYLSKCSLTIINKHVNTQNLYCFPTKLGEYMASGKAVIITNVGEAMNWLEDGLNASIVEPGDVENLADALAELMSDCSLRKRLGAGARNLCEKAFDYRAYTQVLSDYFKTISANIQIE